MSDLVFVLHRRPYRERSELLKVLGAEGGIYTLVAHGVRSLRPKFHVPEFNLLHIETSGQGQEPDALQTLLQAQLQESPVQLQGMAIYMGLYLNELCLVLLPEQMPCPELFLVYHQTLQELCTQETLRMELGLRQFERVLLELCAHREFFCIEIEQGRPIQRDGFYVLTDDSGFVPSGSGYAGADLLDLHTGQWQELRLRQLAKQIFRHWLHIHRQGRPLKSRELLRQIWSQLPH